MSPTVSGVYGGLLAHLSIEGGSHVIEEVSVTVVTPVAPYGNPAQSYNVSGACLVVSTSYDQIICQLPSLATSVLHSTGVGSAIDPYLLNWEDPRALTVVGPSEVIVTVNNVSASQRDCLTYDPALLESVDFHISSVQPPALTAVGSGLLRIEGRGFAGFGESDEISVALGDYPCAVVNATDEFIACTTLPDTPGKRHLRVFVPGVGWSFDFLPAPVVEVVSHGERELETAESMATEELFVDLLLAVSGIEVQGQDSSQLMQVAVTGGAEQTIRGVGFSEAEVSIESIVVDYSVHDPGVHRIEFHFNNVAGVEEVEHRQVQVSMGTRVVGVFSLTPSTAVVEAAFLETGAFHYVRMTETREFTICREECCRGRNSGMASFRWFIYYLPNPGYPPMIPLRIEGFGIDFDYITDTLLKPTLRTRHINGPENLVRTAVDEIKLILPDFTSLMTPYDSAVHLGAPPLVWWSLDDSNRQGYAQNGGSMGWLGDGFLEVVELEQSGFSRKTGGSSGLFGRLGERDLAEWSSLFLPFKSMLASPDFTTEFWFRRSIDRSRSHDMGFARILMAHSSLDTSQGSPRSGADGHVIWLNPCGELEVWIATSDRGSSSESLYEEYWDQLEDWRSSSNDTVWGSNNNITWGNYTDLDLERWCEELDEPEWKPAGWPDLISLGWQRLVGPAVSLTTWHHVSLAYSRQTSTATLYVDGQATASLYNMTYVPNYGGDLYFGALPSAVATVIQAEWEMLPSELGTWEVPVYGWHGWLDEILLWDSRQPSASIALRAAFERDLLVNIGLTVNSISADCHLPADANAGLGCIANLVPLRTPSLSLVTPRDAAAGDVITILGTSFHPDRTKNLVQVGDVSDACEVTLIDETLSLLECVLRESVPGLGESPLKVYVSGYGWAREVLYLNTLSRILAIHQETVSTVGGALITVSGVGFVPELDRMRVWLGSSVNAHGNTFPSPCTVVAATETRVDCITTPTLPGIFQPSVHVLSQEEHAFPAIFCTEDSSQDLPKFRSCHVTAQRSNFTINGVHPSVVVSGQELHVFGSFLDLTPDDMQVSLSGEVSCDVVHVDESTISCIVGDGPAGVHFLLIRSLSQLSHGYIPINDTIVSLVAEGGSASRALIAEDAYLNWFAKITVRPVIEELFVPDIRNVSFGGGILLGIEATSYPQQGDADSFAVSVAVGDTPCEVVHQENRRLYCMLHPHVEMPLDTLLSPEHAVSLSHPFSTLPARGVANLSISDFTLSSLVNLCNGQGGFIVGWHGNSFYSVYISSGIVGLNETIDDISRSLAVGQCDMLQTNTWSHMSIDYMDESIRVFLDGDLVLHTLNMTLHPGSVGVLAAKGARYTHVRLNHWAGSSGASLKEDVVVHVRRIRQTVSEQEVYEPFPVDVEDFEVGSHCFEGYKCSISWSPAVTPRVKSILIAGQPASTARASQQLTVIGSGFAECAREMKALVFDIDSNYHSECDIVWSSSEKLECTLPELGGGVYFLKLWRENYGFSQVPALSQSPSLYAQHVVVYEAGITDVSPASGSLAGGNEVLLRGFGLPKQEEFLSVSFCGRPCNITSTSYESASCISSPLLPLVQQQQQIMARVAAHGYDDAAETNSVVDLSSPILFLGGNVLALRFTELDIPRGAHIVSAKLLLTAANKETTPMSIILSVEDSANSPAIKAQQGSISARKRKSVAGPLWPLAMWQTAGQTWESPDFSNALESVTEKHSWEEGNAVTVFLEGSLGATREIFAATGARGRSEFPTLKVAYVPPTYQNLVAESASLHCPAVIELKTGASLSPQRSCRCAFPPLDESEENLASGKPVHATYAPETAHHVVDSDPATMWEGAPGVQHNLTIDLGTSTVLQRLVVSWNSELPQSWHISVAPDVEEASPYFNPNKGATGIDDVDSGSFHLYTGEIRESTGSSYMPVMTLSQDHHVERVTALNLMAAPSAHYPAHGYYHSNASVPFTQDFFGLRSLHGRFLRISIVSESDRVSPLKIAEIAVFGCPLLPLSLNSGSASTSSLLEVDSCTRNGSETFGARALVSSYEFVYDAAFTPLLYHSSPRVGGSAGGTFITIQGAGFGDSPHKVSVAIGGTLCIPSHVTNSQIICRTEARGASSGVLPIEVLVDGVGRAAPYNGTATFQFMDRWSSRATWSGNAPPGPGDSVVVPPEQTLLIDDDVDVYAFLVQGHVVFADEKDLTFDAHVIMVNGGSWTIGTSDQPFLHRVTITLHGDINQEQLPIYGTKCLAGRYAVIDMHGFPHEVTWTQLAATVSENDTFISLEHAVSWPVGAEIVISSTDWSQDHVEKVRIVSISEDARTLEIEPKLQLEHLGEVRTFAGQPVTLKAEVGLLSRNIKFQGDSISEQFQFGAHLMLHSPGHETVIGRLDNVEFHRVGQAFNLGRYPVHFHMIGEVSESYIKRCSVHRSFNRAYTVHGVHRLRIQSNVAYDIMGHTYFIEDAIETSNILEGNIGFQTKPSRALLNTDQTPAVFWITNPANEFRQNVASGGSHYGFWVRPEPKVTGASATEGLGQNVCPETTPLGEFADNVAHSNGRYGLRIYEQLVGRSSPCNGGSALTISRFKRLLSYRNNKNGVTVTAGGGLVFEDFKVIDNRLAGFELAGAQGGFVVGPWEMNTIDNALFVGATDEFDPLELSVGIMGPADHGILVRNPVFVNYDKPRSWALRHCAKCERFTPNGGGWNMRFQGVTWVNSTNRAFWRWKHEGIWTDLDGSLTETGIADSTLVPVNGFVHTLERCIDDPRYNGGFGGKVCKGLLWRRVAVNGATPSSLQYKDMAITVNGATDYVEWNLKRKTHPRGHLFTVPVNHEVELGWRQAAFQRVDIEAYNIAVGELLDEEYLIFKSYYLQQPDHFEVLRSFSPLPGPINPTDMSLRFGDWYWDEEASAVKWIAVNRGGSERRTIGARFFANECPLEGCPIPPPPSRPSGDGVVRPWSAPATWTVMGEHVPQDGSEVLIPNNFVVKLDVSTPILRKLEVYGILFFDEEATQTLELTAETLIIYGWMDIGEIGRPYLGNAIISLYGDKTIPDLRMGLTNFGSKALGVLGTLRLVGKQPDFTWTRLSQTAEAGDTSILVEGNAADWQPNATIAIASTTFEPSLAEERVMLYAEWLGDGRTLIVLRDPLEHTHTRAAHEFPSDHGGLETVEIAAEVGLLSRNIKIQSVDRPGLQPTHNSHFGCRVLVTRDRIPIEVAPGVIQHISYTGKATIASVEFEGCGQGSFDDRMAIEFSRSVLWQPTPEEEGQPQYAEDSMVTKCAFHNSYHHAVGVSGITGAIITENVAFKTIGSAFLFLSTGHKVVNNLAVWVISPATVGTANEGKNMVLSAGFESRKVGNVFIGNSVGGSERSGFWMPAEQCLDQRQPVLTATAGGETTLLPPSEMIANNTVHGCGFGWFVMDIMSFTCAQIVNFTAYHNWEYGIMYFATPALRLTRFVSAHNKVGIMANVYRPPSLSHLFSAKTVTIVNSIFVGALPSTACSSPPPIHRYAWSWGYHGQDDYGLVGVMLSSFTSAGPKPLEKAPPHTISSYPALYGKVRFSTVTFASFHADSCGFANHALMSNPKSPDWTTPHDFTSVTWVDVATNSKVYFHPPNPSWINEEDCVDMDCDGPKHILLSDIDGTFLGGNAHSSIFSEAEHYSPNAVGAVVPMGLRATLNEQGQTMLLDEADFAVARGIMRPSGCAFVHQWNAWQCDNDFRYRFLIVESMDPDTETRRLSPVALLSGSPETGNNGYLDLLNGPMDRKSCLVPFFQASFTSSMAYRWLVRRLHLFKAH